MSQSQYIGRRYDVMTYQGVEPVGEVLLTPGLATEEAVSGTICTGIQKLVQRFLILLVTEVGSKPYDLEAGTTFMTELRQGSLRTDLDVRTAFSLAVGAISTQLAAIEDDETPDDERFSDATLENLQIQIGSMALQIRISSVAGVSRVPILPLDIAV